MTFPNSDLNPGFLNKFPPTIWLSRDIRSIELTVLKKILTLWMSLKIYITSLAAMCKAVYRSLVVASTWAPDWSNSTTMSTLPKREAMCRGVCCSWKGKIHVIITILRTYCWEKSNNLSKRALEKRLPTLASQSVELFYLDRKTKFQISTTSCQIFTIIQLIGTFNFIFIYFFFLLFSLFSSVLLYK